ncbi:MAG: YggT family protein [Gemmatimonas sp.]|nr:YggT family protein [Gemmatimonas sp.]
MLEALANALNTLLYVLRPVVFGTGVLAGIGAVASWAVRTRRISPFSGGARFIRERVDPVLVAPMERKLLRAGGTPYAAPWWSLAAVVLGGLLLISGIQFLRDQIAMMAFASQSGTGLLMLAVKWTFSILRVALFARVVSSWVGGGPYSKWWRWSYVLTEWFLAPLRNVIPTIGMIDISVLVAYFGLGILESVITRAIF